MHSLGINVGSSNLKLVLLEDETPVWSAVAPHEGNVGAALAKLLSEHSCPPGTRALTTGTEGRYLIETPSVIEPLCVEAALKGLALTPDAAVSMGGETLVVYTLDRAGRIVSSFSGNKCASGTGEFFCQQLGRMDMTLDDVAAVSDQSRALKLSSRCSVFMKSDCTHRMNKGEADPGDIVMSLSHVMAGKVAEFLKKARVAGGRVLLTGGLTRNRFLVRRLRAMLPEVEFTIPDAAPYFEAYGAALLAREIGAPLPPPERRVVAHDVQFARFESLRTAMQRVTIMPSRRGRVRAGRSYMLGVDGGSTTTKACLIDMETDEIAAAHYGRTHGDPVRALKGCIAEIRKQADAALGAGAPVAIALTATTGSSREILGVFLETAAVYNEIIAHAAGVAHFAPETDTLFEIGGQDAKYVLLRNGVPIDYAMNEACSAGTGSFLEESCRGDLNIEQADRIGPIALAADRPLKFGEHCSAFINSDIRKAIQQGATREDIASGLVASVVANYLNRVVGNRTVGHRIALQGGVAKNEAVPAAFALHLQKEVVVPPDPELMGCFGVGLIARRKMREGLLEARPCTLESILAASIENEREFTCKSCENYCPIRVLRVGGHRYNFGGRCNKYANLRKKKSEAAAEPRNYVERRQKIVFEECAPDPAALRKRREGVVGVPRAFSVYSLWPLYAGFFHELGVETLLSEELSEEGMARVESGYCFPAEIAHGAVQSLIERGVDWLFLPHARDMESLEKDVHACFCPITQSLPYYLRKAFGEWPPEKILAPVVTFKYGEAKARESFVALGAQLGFDEREARRAFAAALARQRDCAERLAALGREALDFARRASQPVVTLLGRPYNAFTGDANMGIPRKFVSRGYSVIPFDILPFRDEQIRSNMYWYYGQQDMKAAELIKAEPNLYATYITNFSCAPDSFMLHYLKWTMGAKPFLILEIDSHSADAGVDTRVEAFLDIIEGSRREAGGTEEERYDNGLRFEYDSRVGMVVRNEHTGETQPLTHNPRVKFLLANMGRLATELAAAALRSTGVNAEALPLPDANVLRMARAHTSGKECLPSQLVLGEALRYFSSGNYRKDEIYLLFVPTTTGPCRTGQYSVFYRNLFRDLRLENVLVVTLESDNSYNEMGPGFSRRIWWSVVVSDYMKDVETSLRACARDPQEALRVYDSLWRSLVAAAEKDLTRALPELRRIAGEIARIPLARAPRDCPKILIVGEIYVRRDDFAVDELIQLFSSRGIIGKVSGVGEWIYYCDHIRRDEIRKRLKLTAGWRRPFSRSLRERIGWSVEQAYKRRVDHAVQKALAPSGLLIETPHNMDEIMGNARRHFVHDELQSEISVSSGAAATAMLDGFSGVVNISPFACLIGRVIEGVFTPWAREGRYPVLSVEIDGNLLPPGLVANIEIFMLNVLRFRQEVATATLVDRGAASRKLLSRK
jgi:predicted CoA-substrate-specific enzyme activase